ncbi:MAG: hypothetical protein L6R42_005465 [Xanthoria sp. 1 TBL-2021]|nr:MAG: hypothetical protein L6R42_005465 [Xanthoria sp. 1 TBL-2021]
MAQKRKTHPSAANGARSKRHRFNHVEEDEANPASKAQVDPTYGQRSAFPGLDGQPSGDDLFYGPAEDGLEYLRMVRSEAKGVPNLLTSASLEETSLYQDYSRGYYDDGAYTAMPLPLADGTTKIEGDEDIDPQEAYYAHLCEQLQSLHTALHASPPPLAPNESTAAIAAKLNDGASSRIWRMTLLYTQPTSTLLSQLDQDTVIAGIAALEKYMAWKTLEKESYLGAWAWGLLARCREVGMMGSEDVGVIRDLGKKARAMVRLLAAGLGGAQGIQIEGKGEIDGDEENLVNEGEHDRPNEVSGNGKDEMEVVHRVGSMDSIHIQQEQDMGSLRPMGPTQDIPHGVAANSSEREPLVTVKKDQQLPSIDDDEIAEAQERLLTTLHETISSPPSDPPTNFNHCSSSSPLKTDPQINDRTSMMSPQRSSSPAYESLPLNPVPLTMRVAATLDMIITIVGEAYGQRDLLEGRMVWD